MSTVPKTLIQLFDCNNAAKTDKERTTVRNEFHQNKLCAIYCTLKDVKKTKTYNNPAFAPYYNSLYVIIKNIQIYMNCDCY